MDMDTGWWRKPGPQMWTLPRRIKGWWKSRRMTLKLNLHSETLMFAETGLIFETILFSSFIMVGLFKGLCRHFYRGNSTCALWPVCVHVPTVSVWLQRLELVHVNSCHMLKWSRGQRSFEDSKRYGPCTVQQPQTPPSPPQPSLNLPSFSFQSHLLLCSPCLPPISACSRHTSDPLSSQPDTKPCSLGHIMWLRLSALLWQFEESATDPDRPRNSRLWRSIERKSSHHASDIVFLWADLERSPLECGNRKYWQL